MNNAIAMDLIEPLDLSTFGQLLAQPSAIFRNGLNRIANMGAKIQALVGCRADTAHSRCG
ncbi:hypothetical protein GCM10007053_27190 [Halioglobus pacificus]|uniref:Uncharacterized protein n=1 Tax=Parahalioglobus pacificus TaxID=930806 RepID=A0A919CLW9_9GAMM|nr:hypothetical protein GCM10007053_27190 [Halioglobus pacificus]